MNKYDIFKNGGFWNNWCLIKIFVSEGNLSFCEIKIRKFN